LGQQQQQRGNNGGGQGSGARPKAVQASFADRYDPDFQRRDTPLQQQQQQQQQLMMGGHPGMQQQQQQPGMQQPYGQPFGGMGGGMGGGMLGGGQFVHTGQMPQPLAMPPPQDQRLPTSGFEGLSPAQLEQLVLAQQLAMHQMQARTKTPCYLCSLLALRQMQHPKKHRR
jgi:hypothetical protein